MIFAREPRNRGVPLARIAMPEVLGPAGYSTALFGKWHVSTDNEVTLDTAALEHGYATWLAGAATNIGKEGDGSHSDWLRLDDGRVRHSKAYDSLAITKSFVEWWQKPATQPRFAVVSYLTPHEPFTPPPADLLPPGVAPVDASADARTRYEAALSALDTLIGRVVAAIDLTITYVFVFPDNGTPASVPPPGGRYQGYKATTFQGGVHVPLIVLGPDVPSGTCDHLTHVVDLPRTVFELCGVPCANGFEDSRSFAASVLGADQPPREPVFLHHRAPNTAAGPFERDPVGGGRRRRLETHERRRPSRTLRPHQGRHAAPPGGRSGAPRAPRRDRGSSTQTMTSATSLLLRLVAVCAAVLLATSAQEPLEDAAPTPSAEPTRPNVVVVVIDDMAWEDVFSVPMPELQALIAKGRTYESFYVDPVCSPSRYALQFGRRGIRDGIVGAITLFENSAGGTPRNRRSIGDALRDSGYATALFGKWHLSTRREFRARKGPDSLLECVRDFGYEHWYAGNASNLGRGASFSQADWLRTDDGVEARSREYASTAVVDAFTRWWSTADERPRMAVVNLFAPHEPFTHPPKELIANGHAFPATDRDAYENALVAVDTLIGRIAASVDTTNTYLFVLPDNGTPKNVPPPDAKSRGYKHSVWQGGINVPFVALGPGVVHGVSKHLAHVVDVPATVLELCGAPTGEAFEDGVSFAASLTGDAPPREPVVVLARQRRMGAPLLTAVIDADGWKLVDTTTEQFLFDLSKDPFEKAPVDDPERKAALLELAREVGGLTFDKRAERMNAELEGLKGGEAPPPDDDER